MYICEYVYVFKEVLGVSTRQVTNICQFAQLDLGLHTKVSMT